jgi:hypothetical protein
MANTITYYDDAGNPYTFDKDSGKLISSPNANDSTNKTGADLSADRKVTWKGGPRSDSWMPPAFTQTYGNYTGLFPSMGQQVGQALFGSTQPKDYLPSWYQSMLPERQNHIVDVRKYFGNNPAMQTQQFGSRVMNNPYPLNGSILFGKANMAPMTNQNNPYIGGYQGLTGYNPGQQQVGNPGGGTWSTPNPLSGTSVRGGDPTGPPLPPPTPMPPPKPPEAPNPPGYVAPPRPIPPLPTYRPGFETPITQQPPVTRYPVAPIGTPVSIPEPPHSVVKPPYDPNAPAPTYGVPRLPPSGYNLYMGGTPPTADAQMINSILSLFSNATR